MLLQPPSLSGMQLAGFALFVLLGVGLAGKEEVGVFSGEEKVCVEILLVFSEIEMMMTECKKGLRKSGGPFVLWMRRG